MARTIPIYKDHDETYRADSCGPLAEAYRTSRIKLKALCHGHYPGTRLPEEAMHGVKMLGFWDRRKIRIGVWAGTGTREWKWPSWNVAI